MVTKSPCSVPLPLPLSESESESELLELLELLASDLEPSEAVGEADELEEGDKLGFLLLGDLSFLGLLSGD